VSPRAGLDDVEKRKFLTLLGLGLRPLRWPACSQSLYRLRCPGSTYERNVPLLLCRTGNAENYTQVLTLGGQQGLVDNNFLEQYLFLHFVPLVCGRFNII
jgi:hypothetical protein